MKELSALRFSAACKLSRVWFIGMNRHSWEFDDFFLNCIKYYLTAEGFGIPLNFALETAASVSSTLAWYSI